MGIDYGTGGVRVGIFDLDGAPSGFHAVEFETSHPRPGWAEQDPARWWTALQEAVRGALDASGVAPEDIAGIGTDATSATVVALDEQGEHLAQAILWMDVRASDQAARVAGTGDPALKYSGYGAVSAEWGLPKALWLKENEPDTYAAARYIVDGGDWLTRKLTGEWTASINMASSKYFYDRDTGGWPVNLYEASGGADLLEKFPERVEDLGVAVGGLTADAAAQLGLKAGTPVAQGGIDAYMGALGLGVVAPGTLALITGSSHVMIGQSAQPLHGQGFWGSYTDAMIRGQYTVEAGQVSTGSVVAWFKRHLAGGEVAEAVAGGEDAYAVLNRLAAAVPIGSDGLTVVDYFQGNRSPHTDPLARGVITGLTLSHTTGHIFRAILEGICFGTEDIFRTMREHSFEPKLNVVSGGPAKSDLWMQMHADVSNVPMSFTKVSEGPVLGSAMLGAVAAGAHADIAAAAAQMVHVERTIEPDPARHEEYAFWLDRYLETYPRLKDMMHASVRHVAELGRAAAATA
jgi:FGGY-family pentulose kinase